MTEPLLQASNVAKRYGYRPVLRDISVELRPADCLAVLGPNGSGKTTLLRVLAGLSRPTSGSVTRRGTLSLVGHHSMVYGALSARENLRFFARLGGVAERRVTEVLEMVGLADRADDRAGTFSRGMLQRLTIARAMLPHPRVLLLDEPLTGLDEMAAATFQDSLLQLRDQGCALLLVSHELAFVTRLGRHVAFLSGGRLSPPSPMPQDAESLSAAYRSAVWNA